MITNTDFIINYNQSSISDNYYPFISINENVSIVPMSNLFCERIRKRFKRDMSGIILPYGCFHNAIVSAFWFQQHGFDDVEVVDGYYSENPDAVSKLAKKYNSPFNPNLLLVNSEHRFLKRGNKYFDTTLEFLYGFETAKCFEYRACRAFEPSVIAAYAVKVAQTNNIDTTYLPVSSMEGITYKQTTTGEIKTYWGKISDDFKFVL